MELTGEFLIEAPRETVWAALNDVDVLRVCIPGCETLEQTSDTTMEARVTQKIGPVKATFTGEVELVNIDAPAGYTIQGQGKGGVAGFAKGSADVHLTEEPDGTRLVYTAKATVGGKLAQLGGRLINSTAKKLADQFFERFHDHLNSREPAKEG